MFTSHCGDRVSTRCKKERRSSEYPAEAQSDVAAAPEPAERASMPAGAAFGLVVPVPLDDTGVSFWA